MKKMMTGAALAMVMAVPGTMAVAQQEVITVAYFLEWPMPFQFAKVNDTYDEALGVKVNWVAFDSGTAMSAAMASGDIQIAVSQGVPPFVVATSGGQDLQVVDVAVSYSENDNCVVASALEIDKNSAADLAGKKVAVPLGTAAHYGFLRQMDHFGVDINSMALIDMAPAEGAAALSQGAVDMACGWGGALRRMKEVGNVLLTGAEKEELGILVFDVTSVPASFAAEKGNLLAKFLKVTADANAMWNAGQNRDVMLPVIARDAGMDVADAEDTMATFTFPPVAEQLGPKWLGGGSQEFMKGVAQVFVNSGAIDAALPSYEDAVNIGPLRAASGL